MQKMYVFWMLNYCSGGFSMNESILKFPQNFTYDKSNSPALFVA